MPFSAKFIKELDKLQPDLKEVLLELLAEIERNREESITRSEFRQFAQETDQNFQHVWKAIGELTEAQKRTEKRVEELAEAQSRTERRLEKLAQAQERTEQRLGKLAAAQERTEEALTKLTVRVDDLTVQLGGISDTVGYGLEDKSFPALKERLKAEFGIEVDRRYRRNLLYSRDRFDEINIYGEGRKNGKKLLVIGKSKAQFGIKDVTKFKQLLERVKAHLGQKIFPLALAYHYHPHAEAKLQEENIRYYWSHELQT